MRTWTQYQILPLCNVSIYTFTTPWTILDLWVNYGVEKNHFTETTFCFFAGCHWEIFCRSPASVISGANQVAPEQLAPVRPRNQWQTGHIVPQTRKRMNCSCIHFILDLDNISPYWGHQKYIPNTHHVKMLVAFAILDSDSMPNNTVEPDYQVSSLALGQNHPRAYTLVCCLRGTDIFLLLARLHTKYRTPYLRSNPFEICRYVPSRVRAQSSVSERAADSVPLRSCC